MTIGDGIAIAAGPLSVALIVVAALYFNQRK